MSTWRSLYHLARADYLERSRRDSFLITMLAVVVIAYAYLPPLDADGVTFFLGSYRGIYNSAWVGTVVAALCATLLSIPGFFLVKNAIERDTTTRVGQILATTPISRLQYILGKYLSNLFFLSVMVAAIMVAALAMQLLRGESREVELWRLVAPFLFTTLPVMALVSAVALLFEAIPWLRGGFGNIAYLALYLFVVMDSVILSQAGGVGRLLSDPFGLGEVAADMSRSLQAVYPEYAGGLVIGASSVRGPIQTFVWEGIDWGPLTLAARLAWVGVSLGIALLASLLFDRFGDSSESASSPRVGLRRARRGAAPHTLQEAPAEALALAVPAPKRTLNPLERGGARSPWALGPFLAILVAELKLMLKGLRWWWYLGAGVLVVVGLLASGEELRQLAYLGAWLWPVLIWSAAGTREQQHQTEAIVYSCARPLLRLLPATWLAGVLLALLTASGVAASLLMGGRWAELQALLVGALFVPSLALGLGTLSGSRRLFEAVYLMLWYLGPASRLPALDFMGTTLEPGGAGLALYFLAATVVLLGVALLGRRRRLAAG